MKLLLDVSTTPKMPRFRSRSNWKAIATAACGPRRISTKASPLFTKSARRSFAAPDHRHPFRCPRCRLLISRIPRRSPPYAVGSTLSPRTTGWRSLGRALICATSWPRFPSGLTARRQRSLRLRGHAIPVVSGLLGDRGWIADARAVMPDAALSRFADALAHPLPGGKWRRRRRRRWCTIASNSRRNCRSRRSLELGPRVQRQPETKRLLSRRPLASL